MSDDSVITCCACCGKAEVDDVKLKKCSCLLVKYCSVDCQKNHRPQHKKACKKRLAELRDDKLFTQPDESYLGECPICCLPLPLDKSTWRINSCCCKLICRGCTHANSEREIERGMEQRCPFCREPVPRTQEECYQNYMKRVKVNDPIALCQVGFKCYKEEDYEGAIEYYTKAAQLGYAEAHYKLSIMYDVGRGVEEDLKKNVHHLEEAAIGGHHLARYNLGSHEYRNGRTDRATKHYIIAAKLGLDNALGAMKKDFVDGYSSKEDYAAALRGYQAAVDATKSKQRDVAYAYYESLNRE